MASLFPLTIYTAPNRRIEVGRGVLPLDAARRWAAAHPDWSGLLSVHVPGKRYSEYLVADGRARPAIARVPAGAPPCPDRFKARHRVGWRWDEDNGRRPFALVCTACGQELARWPVEGR